MSPKSRRPFIGGSWNKRTLKFAVAVFATVGAFYLPARKTEAVFTTPEAPIEIKTSNSRASLSTQPVLHESYGKLPLSFEANQGQTDHLVKFLSRGNGYGLFLTSSEAVLRLGIADHRSPNERNDALNFRSTKSRNPKSAVLRMKFVGANPAPQITGMDQLPGVSNYFISNDPSKWRTNIPTFAKIKYEDMYPGVDL